MSLFRVHYAVHGMFTFAPLWVHVLADDEDKAREWFIKHHSNATFVNASSDIDYIEKFIGNRADKAEAFLSTIPHA